MTGNESCFRPRHKRIPDFVESMHVVDHIICNSRPETIQKLKRAIGKQDNLAVKEAQLLLVKRRSVSKAENRLSHVSILKLLEFGERKSATVNMLSVNVPVYSGKQYSEIVDAHTTH